MTRIILLKILLALSIKIFSQELNVLGTIVNDKGKPISYANIYFEKDLQGTISNEKGEFALSISTNKINDDIIISFIGYNIKRIQAKDCLKNKKIVLQPNTILLESISVYANEGIEILEKVIKNLKKNHSIEKTNFNTYVLQKEYSKDSSYKHSKEAFLNISVLNKKTKYNLNKYYVNDVEKHKPHYLVLIGHQFESYSELYKKGLNISGTNILRKGNIKKINCNLVSKFKDSLNYYAEIEISYKKGKLSLIVDLNSYGIKNIKGNLEEIEFQKYKNKYILKSFKKLKWLNEKGNFNDDFLIVTKVQTIERDHIKSSNLRNGNMINLTHFTELKSNKKLMNINDFE